MLAGLGHCYAMAGNRKKAQARLAVLKQLSSRKYVASAEIAIVSEALGDRYEAQRFLQKAVNERSASLCLSSDRSAGFDLTFGRDDLLRDLVHGLGRPARIDQAELTKPQECATYGSLSLEIAI